ncbi:hypothetical protein SAMN02745196_00886 [Clostridium collagenovorans DSM 3089]|uniref:Uncharacterized protein n=1 Tax=Clostridium collagenovorans DSM 3089 TaxID=1121306 RepID=A0A1M5U7Z2_9CLOT|nr:hypothetical protein [Clostridium collagenovorans]SHH59175.1 hypothetical protein SAMN02745196_00886 [Clostridium collagenovorans DSM 3089]
MQAIMETLFDVIYLTTVIVLGVKMIKNSKAKSEHKLFGFMAVILGLGDSFHLVPRAYALLTDGLEAHAAALGVGKFITSITMTIFYVILYYVWKERYKAEENKSLTISIYLLAAVRIILCLFPQNEWLNYHSPVSWGVYRNIPFAILGAIIIYIFYKKAKENKDNSFKFMYLAIILSFGFYIPVVLWASKISWVGMLMIPKTLAYVWIVYMGYKEFKNQR